MLQALLRVGAAHKETQVQHLSRAQLYASRNLLEQEPQQPIHALSRLQYVKS